MALYVKPPDPMSGRCGHTYEENLLPNLCDGFGQLKGFIEPDEACWVPQLISSHHLALGSYGKTSFCRRRNGRGE